MPEITDYEYAEYKKLKQQEFSGEILTPGMLRAICRTMKYEPELIGNYILEHMRRLPQINSAIPEDPELYEPKMVADLGLRVRAFNILYRKGIVKLPQLLALTEEELFNMEGMGKVNANDVLTQLKEHGLSLSKKA